MRLDPYAPCVPAQLAYASAASDAYFQSAQERDVIDRAVFREESRPGRVSERRLQIRERGAIEPSRAGDGDGRLFHGASVIQHDMQQPEPIDRDSYARLLGKLDEVAGISIPRGHRERVFWPLYWPVHHFKRRRRQDAGRRRKCLTSPMLGDQGHREAFSGRRERDTETYAATPDDDDIRRHGQ